MEIFEITERYQDEKLYNMVDVVGSFEEYFGMSLKELELYFGNYLIIEKEKILDYVNYENEECIYLTELINERMLEYDYYRKVLEIFSMKALKCLELVKYLCNCEEKNNSYEQLLIDAEINHYSSILIGKNVNKILIVLFHLLKRFSGILKVMNKEDNFCLQRFSIGFLGSVKEELYPNEELVVVDGYYIDKTSFNVKKKRK